MSNVINFYHQNGEYGCFSNFSNHSVKLKDQVWSTSEHYFQAQKFVDTKWETAVRKCDSPMDAANMGRDRALPLRKDWESVKDDIMREVVYAKFSQNEDCKKTLLSTGDAILVEHTKNDKYWADGGDGSGKNMLGKILMEVRDRVKGEISQEEQEEINNQEKLALLEKEFETLVKTVTPQIEAELKLAKQAIKRAEAIAEEHGVPFASNVYIWAHNNYIPRSFADTKTKMEELCDDGSDLYAYFEELFGFNPEHYNYNGPTGEPGWESDGWSSSSLRC